MTLQEARRRRLWFRFIGRLLVAITGVLLVFGFLNGIYALAAQASSALQKSIFALPANLVALIYTWLLSVMPAVANALWRFSPELNLTGRDRSPAPSLLSLTCCSC